jgi:hypothetical protein
MLMLYTD